MPIVLVVDDSPVDRKLIEGLLKSKLDWIIEFAEDGAKGLEMIDAIYPDIVITDLQMPQLNGLQLCAEVKAEYPHVPVVLITGKGSEDLAADALAAGAVSYVCKDDMSSSLLETVEQVLSVSKHIPPQELLMKYNTNSRFQFTLDNNQGLILPLVDFLTLNMEKLELGDKTDQRHCAIALEEALINALFHGNLELDRLTIKEARRAMHEGSIAEGVSERLNDPQYKSRRIRVGIELTRREVKLIVRDDGPGFATSETMSHAEATSQFVRASGRGLTLVKNFMTDIQFNEQGNEIRMSLQLGPPTRS